MKESGCEHVTLAPESGSPRVLEDIIQKGKDFDLEHLKQCGATAHKLGLKVAAYFVLGLPGETRADMEMTISYARELAKVGVDEVNFGLFIPLPGTPLWEPSKHKIKDMDWLDLLTVGDLSQRGILQRRSGRQGTGLGAQKSVPQLSTHAYYLPPRTIRRYHF